jgi:hypothetical protein
LLVFGPGSVIAKQFSPVHPFHGVEVDMKDKSKKQKKKSLVLTSVDVKNIVTGGMCGVIIDD